MWECDLTSSKKSNFFFAGNILVIILKARPHGSISTSPIKSFQRWNRLFFMPRLNAAFAPFHASSSRASPLDRVNFRHAARHSRRRAANWSFHQYSEPLACLRLQRGIEQSQAATTFCLVQRTVASNDSVVFSKSFSAKSSCVPGGASSFATPTPILAPLCPDLRR